MTTLVSDLPDWIETRLKARLPGRKAQARLEPELSHGRHFHPASPDARPAAVMVLLYPDQENGGRPQWRFPLVLRPETMSDHAGQISLPGGVIEPDESDRQAALRELEEELGVSPGDVRMLGRLSSLHLFVSNFKVTPWIGWTGRRPRWLPNRSEVHELFEVPLCQLLDAGNFGQDRRVARGVEITAPHIQWGGHRIWGATGMILAELAAVVSPRFKADSREGRWPLDGETRAK